MDHYFVGNWSLNTCAATRQRVTKFILYEQFVYQIFTILQKYVSILATTSLNPIGRSVVRVNIGGLFLFLVKQTLHAVRIRKRGSGPSFQNAPNYLRDVTTR